MKFKYLFLGFAALLMTACDKDFDDWGQQAGNEQGSVVTFGNGSVAEVDVINFADIAEGQDSVQVCKITAPTSSYAETANVYEVTFSAKGEELTMKLDSEGRVLYSDFKKFVEGVFGMNPNNTNVINAVVVAYTGDGKTAVKSVLATSGTFSVKAKTDAPFIDPDGYYIVGNIDGWKQEKVAAWHLVNNGGDVYENPKFSCVFDITKEMASISTFEIKLIPSSAFNEDGKGIANWNVALSALPGVETPANEGSFSYENAGGNIKFDAVKGATKIRMTFDLMAGTYQIEAVSIADAYYLIGGELDWKKSATTKEQKFSHSDADVFDDPVFTYLLTGGTEKWFSFGDAKACDAIANDDNYNLIYGFVGSMELSGSFDTRTNLGAENTFYVDGSAPFYLISINMLSKTYEIKPVSPRFYFFGSFSDWNADAAKTALMFPVTSTQFEYTFKVPDGGVWTKMWQEDGLGDWSKCYNAAKANDGTTAESGSIEISDGGSISAPGTGWYTFSFNLKEMSYKWTKIDNQNPTEYTNISLIGEFNSWNGDVELTPAADGHNWYCTFTQQSDGMLKLRANHGWDVNWGFGSNNGDWTVSDADWAKVCTNGGGNIKLPAGTYRIYLNDITNQVCIVEDK